MREYNDWRSEIVKKIYEIVDPIEEEAQKLANEYALEEQADIKYNITPIEHEIYRLTTQINELSKTKTKLTSDLIETKKSISNKWTALCNEKLDELQIKEEKEFSDYSKAHTQNNLDLLHQRIDAIIKKYEKS